MTTFFLTCAALGGGLLIVQLAMAFLGADHHHDVGGDDSSGHHGASEGLHLLSVRAVSAAFAFFGIGGLGAMAMGWPVILAVVLGVLLGGAAMVGVAIVMRSMLRLQRDGSVHIARAIGEAATVYVPIPAALGGTGKVLLTLQGRIVEYQAVTPDAQALPTGAAVIVVDVRGHDTVEVVPLPSVDGVS